MATKRTYNRKHEIKIRNRLKAIANPICPICGQPIDYTLDWYIDPRDGKRKRHPESFEWDHIIPYRDGGADTIENARAVHRVCNQRRDAIERQQRREQLEQARRELNARTPEPVESTSRAWFDE